MAELCAAMGSKKLNISIAVLMGLPASGKTSLVEAIKDRCMNSELLLIPLCFDRFVPHKIQAESVALSEQNVSKLLRKNFVECVNFLLCEIPNVLSVGLSDCVLLLKDRLSSDVDEILPRDTFCTKVTEVLDSLILPRINVRDIVLLVDDNNYYTSMRNEFYQLAKINQTGFCIIYCKTSVTLCRQRNSGRSEEVRVPDKTIVEMSLKLEEPNPLENICDSYCVQISGGAVDNEDDTSETAKGDRFNVKLLMEVLDNSLKNPVEWIPPVDRTEEIRKEQRICSENEIHQADQVLRKWVNKELMLRSLGKKEKESNKQASQSLLKAKNKVLEKLRTGELKVTCGVTQDVEFAAEVTLMARSFIS